MSMTRTAAVAALCGVALAACGGDAEAPAPPLADVYSDIPGTDIVVDPDAGPDVPMASALTFVPMDGDDGIPCQGNDHCTLLLPLDGKLSLQVLYSQGGQPAAAKVVYFAVTSDPSEIGYVSALSAVTGVDGIAGVDVKPDQQVEGQFQVVAHVDDESVEPLYFDVVVTTKDHVPLTVRTVHEGEAEIAHWTVRLFQQGEDGLPGCDSKLDLYDHTAADYQGAIAALTESVKFLDFAGLDAQASQAFTVLAYSTNEAGVVVAWGCDDGAATWTPDSAALVLVPLADRSPLVAGTYGVTTVVDLSSAVPPPYDEPVDLVLALFQNPASQLMLLACQLGGPEDPVGDLCAMVFTNAAYPDTDALTVLGGVVMDAVNQLAAYASEGTLWGSVLQIGGDVADVLVALELHATFTWQGEPESGGTWAGDDGQETWDGVTLKWTTESDCDPLEDDSCGESNLGFGAIQVEPVSAALPASLVDGWSLQIDDHPLPLHYGALVDGVLQKLVLPLLAGNGSDGMMAIDSYEKLLEMLVGGKGCLDPGSEETCCQVLVAQIAAGGELTDDATGEILVAACEDLLALGAEALETSLTNLHPEEGLHLGTAAPCPLYDTDGDLQIDGFGDKSDPCVWTIAVGAGDDAAIFDGIFWGVRLD